MNTVCALPEEGLDKNLCHGCGSSLHLHVCAICQTVTSCTSCSEPLRVTHPPSTYALPEIKPDHVAFRIDRNPPRLRIGARAANATVLRPRAAGRSEPALQQPDAEPSPGARLSIEPSGKASRPPASAEKDLVSISSSGAAPGSSGRACVPASEAGKAAPSSDLAASRSKKRRLPLVLMLASGVAVAGYYAITPAVQTSLISVVGTVTGTIAPATAREGRGQITQKPQLAEGMQPVEKTAQEPPRNAISIAGAHSELPAQVNGSEHATPAATNEAPVAAAAPVPLPVATERTPAGKPIAHAQAGKQAASTSGGALRVVNSLAGGDAAVPDRPRTSSATATPVAAGATAQCPTASQALGLCDGQSNNKSP